MSCRIPGSSPGASAAALNTCTNGSSATTTYDGNGNLKSDSYKGISNITYNQLILPVLITFSSGNSIEIIYDAGGNPEYSGRKTPASGTFRIEAIYHEEGRYYNLNVETNNTVPSTREEYALLPILGLPI